MQKLFKKGLFIVMTVLLVLMAALPVQAEDKVIDEKRGIPIVVYGGNLSDAQVNETKKLLEVPTDQTIEEHSVTGEDLAKYIGGNPNANMYSSVKIVWEEKGSGIKINVVTPDHITQVTSDMYANALLTAGVENATVDVASPVKVTGHSALTGIYKAYDAEGAQLDKERMELANEELGVATDLVDDSGLTQEEVSQLLTEIKQAISENKPATKEDVERIVNEQLKKLDLSLSEADKQMLIDLFEKMRNLNIDFDQVKEQLQDIANTVKDKMDELGLDAGFWEKVGNFFSDLFESMRDFFGGLFKSE